MIDDLTASTVRIRTGQRRLIFATAGRIGLRDEQLHDLAESASEYRTRAIARLTMREARRLIGLLKTMERPRMASAVGAPPVTEISPATLTVAISRGRAQPAPKPARRRRAG